ncbi:MAG TPA: M48 family metallopeptidase [Gemmatimonadales bacterium]|nr:M48 family metallopeptidase [Gemmatimonadales bacterium]
MLLAAIQHTMQQVPVPEPSELALRYYRSGNLLWVINVLVGLLVPAVILFSGWSARLRDWARRVGRGWAGTVLVYVFLYVTLTGLVTLPLAYYQGFVREHAYGLSHQTLAKWTSDTVTSWLVSCVVAGIVALVAYAILRRSPRRWWLWTWFAALPLLILAFLVTPIWIAPLFNKFGPMEDKALEQRILAEARRAGIEDSRVYEVKKSVDTEKVNAYVSGFGNTKRIVLYDTIIQKLTPDELLFVLGHEMGHYVLHHVVILILTTWLIIGALLYLIHRLSDVLLRRWHRQFGFSSLADPASLPLVLLLAGALSLLLDPVQLAISRHLEHEADRFGLELTHDNHAAAMAFVKLQQNNLGIPFPGRLYTLWRASHPSLGERIEFSNNYRPWETGQPLKYGNRFSAR